MLGKHKFKHDPPGILKDWVGTLRHRLKIGDKPWS
jgi:hypothetical protein